LTSDELAAHLAAHGFSLREARFTGLFFGAIEWITKSSKAFVHEFANPALGVSAAASAKLRWIQRYLLLIWCARCASRSGFRQLLGELAHAGQSVMVTTAKLCLWPAASVVDQYYRFRARKEWRQASGDPRGSQMFLLFERTYRPDGPTGTSEAVAHNAPEARQAGAERSPLRSCPSGSGQLQTAQ